MKNDWKEVELGVVIDLYDSKRIPLSGKERSTRQGKYPYYGASGIIDYIDDYIFDGDYLLVAEDGENLNSRKLPISFWGRGKFWVNNHAHILLGKDGKANTDYIRHWFSQANISGYITGAAQPKLSQGNLRRIKLNLPDISVQDKIASTLSNYDNLIEINNRRISILEDIAQSLYREWFVRFRFPGHQDCEFKDSELGRIPEGWEVRKLKLVCNLTMGQSPKSEFYNEDGQGVPFFQGVKDFGFRFPTKRIWCSNPTRFANKDDILFSVRAPVGRLNIAGFDLAIGRGLCAIRHKLGYQSFLYQQLKAIFTTEDMMGNGAIFNSVTKTDIEGIELLCPSNSLDLEMEKQLKPIFRSLDLLSSKNSNLKIQRDLLLPKLISGGLTV
ncbi:MAG: restriction endonuclease subunit S [Planctomycetales bacterium]|nr:restriction endonuclease subunit S [Planctomycetales bacterium]